MRHLVPTSFLKRVLLADAVTGVGCGALMVGATAPLAGLLGLPAALLLEGGLALFACAAFLFWLVGRAEPPRWGVWTIVAVNVEWALGCLDIAFGGAHAPATLGVAFLLVQAATVAVFAELEVRALRRSRVIRPTRPA